MCPSALRILLVLTMVPAPLAVAAARANAEEPEPVDAAFFEKKIVPFLAEHCTACHGAEKKTAGLELDAFRDQSSVTTERDVWENVLFKLQFDEMPPEERPRPPEDEVEAIAAWIEAELDKFNCDAVQDPGRVTIRRLNRVEYNNTLRDLLGIDFQPAHDFPADDVGYGFDNIGDVLSVSPVLMEKYLAAAGQAAEMAIATEPPFPESHKRIFVCQPKGDDRADCARAILTHLARRAYRRPVTDEDIEPLVRLVELAEREGDSFERGIQLALQAVLVSPHFLFRIERDPDPNDAAAAHPVSQYELATRLSYFLWSSMPDEELFRAAERQLLNRPDVLEAQVRRMLADSKSRALVEGFAGQWLQLRSLETAAPDRDRFPAFDDALRTAMRRETELFFETVMREDRSVLEFLDADFTFLNGPLARHYGVEGVEGDDFRRVELDGVERGGVLTQASVLTVTSNPTRTSPVKRGKWILENILGAPPPDPPDGVEELSEDEEVVRGSSLRERMEQHRSKPSCAVCHEQMDALGFGFENYDAVGAWRTRDGEFEIDPSGTLPDEESFQGPSELKRILKAKRDAFSRCLAEKMLTYALGRGLEYYDRCAVDEICRELAESDFRFSGLVMGIVKSTPFQMRRGDGGER